MQQTGTNSATVKTPDSTASVEKEYEKLLEDDDIAQQEVDTWIQENGERRAKGGDTDSEPTVTSGHGLVPPCWPNAVTLSHN